MGKVEGRERVACPRVAALLFLGGVRHDLVSSRCGPSPSPTPVPRGRPSTPGRAFEAGEAAGWRGVGPGCGRPHAHRADRPYPPDPPGPRPPPRRRGTTARAALPLRPAARPTAPHHRPIPSPPRLLTLRSMISAGMSNSSTMHSGMAPPQGWRGHESGEKKSRGACVREAHSRPRRLPRARARGLCSARLAPSTISPDHTARQSGGCAHQMRAAPRPSMRSKRTPLHTHPLRRVGGGGGARRANKSIASPARPPPRPAPCSCPACARSGRSPPRPRPGSPPRRRRRGRPR